MTSEQQEKWLKVVTTELMSSEESEGDDIVVHPLLWRSKYVNNMFGKIDAYCTRKKSSQAKRQTKCRKSGPPSSRPQPSDPDIPDWALSTELTESGLH